MRFKYGYLISFIMRKLEYPVKTANQSKVFDIIFEQNLQAHHTLDCVTNGSGNISQTGRVLPELESICYFTLDAVYRNTVLFI